VKLRGLRPDASTAVRVDGAGAEARCKREAAAAMRCGTGDSSGPIEGAFGTNDAKGRGPMKGVG
jgi:hypothetical protein